MGNPIITVEQLANTPDDWTVLEASVEQTVVAPGARHYRAAAAAHAERGHIPGARFADMVADFSDPDGRFPFTRPDPGRFEAAARGVGVSSGSRLAKLQSVRSGRGISKPTCSRGAPLPSSP